MKGDCIIGDCLCSRLGEDCIRGECVCTCTLGRNVGALVGSCTLGVGETCTLGGWIVGGTCTLGECVVICILGGFGGSCILGGCIGSCILGGCVGSCILGGYTCWGTMFGSTLGAPGGFAARPRRSEMCSNAFSVAFPKSREGTMFGLFCKMKTMSEAA